MKQVGSLLYATFALATGACGSVDPEELDAAGVDATTPDALNVDAGWMADCSGTGLVACYEMEPSSPPTRIADSSPNALHGVGAGVSYVQGRSGMALSFNPATSSVVIADNAAFDVTEVTMDLWVHPQSVIGVGARQGLLDVNGQYGIFMVDQNTLRCATGTAAGGPTAITTVAVPIVDWTHIACSYSASAGLQVYLDGQAVTSVAGNGPLVSTPVDGPVIGGNSPCTTSPCADPYDGAIDHVRIWNRVLTAQEICRAAARTDC